MSIKYTSVAIIAVISLAGCKPANPPVGESAHIVISFTDGVKLKRKSWKTFSPVGFGTKIYPGDLVLRAGTVKIVCSDLQARVLSSGGPEPTPCPSGSDLPEAIPPYLELRSGAAGGCPTVLTPRAGLLLDRRPRLRWTSVPGVASYTVTIRTGPPGKETDWKRELAYPGEAPYPSDLPVLKAGESITVRVSTVSARSQECDPVRSEARVATESEANSLRRAESRIRQLGLDLRASSLLRANLFFAHKFYAEAIAQIDATPRSFTEPAFCRLLGDVWLASNAPDRALDAYRQALLQMESAPDLEAQTALNTAVYRLTGDPSERARCLERAVALYRQLGDDSDLESLTAQSNVKIR